MNTSPRNKSLTVAAISILAACLLPVGTHFFPGNFLNSLELDSFDWRMRNSSSTKAPLSPNLGAIYLTEDSITHLSENYLLDFPYPRWVHGRIIRELSNQGAKAVAFDILFNERRHDSGSPHHDVKTGEEEDSDVFAAFQMSAADNVILAASDKGSPAPLFATNAFAVAHISTKKDHDGVLRRIAPFVPDPQNGGRLRWHMGIVLAARQLDLDLDSPEFVGNNIQLTSRTGTPITIPLDRNGKMLIDWVIGFQDERLQDQQKIIRYDAVFEDDEKRQWAELSGDQNDPGSPTKSAEANPFKNHLVVVGSAAEGNNVTDQGSTPLSTETPLVITHLNVANMLLMNRFIVHPGLIFEIFLVLLLGALASLITLKTQPYYAGLWIICFGIALTIIAVFLFASLRIWLPLVVPIAGGLFLPYMSLVTFRLVFEETEQKRVKNVFKSIVSPNVVNELLSTDTLSLGGSRRLITVFFADIRGFTQMTDSKQSKAEQFVRDQNLPDEEAEAYFDRSSSEVLATVNSYLALIADVIKKHDGTLDKYIGDCVMAFWGAPTPNEKHAVSCVRAAVDAQRAIYNFNQERATENQRIKDSGEDSAKLDLLSLGTGINTGMATVGLMGSKEHISNYTVFGGGVNLASRMESLSGRSRIFIGEATFIELQKYAPELAATCVLQPPTTVKGIHAPVTHYEVPWKEERPADKKPN